MGGNSHKQEQCVFNKRWLHIVGLLMSVSNIHPEILSYSSLSCKAHLAVFTGSNKWEYFCKSILVFTMGRYDYIIHTILIDLMQYLT